MADPILTTASTVTCVNQGMASISTSNTRVVIDGAPAALATDTYTVAGCSYVEGNTPKPCVSASWSNTSTRVKVMGQPVVLESSSGQTTPNSHPASVDQVQRRVKGT